MSSSEDKKIKEYKIVIVGESGVGKTHLLIRYLYKTFSHNCTSTISTTYVSKTVTVKDDKEIILQLWDTAGQETYRSISKLFYKNAAVIIMVYDITGKDSFEQIKNFWYQQVKEYASPEVKIAIVGNKFDLYENEQVSEEEGKKFAESIGAIFQLTSALDSYGVDDLFISIANSLENSDFYIGGNESKVNLSKKKKKKKNKKKFC